MTSHPATALIADARVDEILDALNASDAGLRSLDTWSASSDIEHDRIIEGPDITYVRLVGEAEQGGPVVLMHFEGVWERATKTAPLRADRASAPDAPAPRPAVQLHGRTRRSRRRATASGQPILSLSELRHLPRSPGEPQRPRAAG